MADLFRSGVFSNFRPARIDEMWTEFDILTEREVPCLHEPTHEERMAGEGVHA